MFGRVSSSSLPTIETGSPRRMIISADCEEETEEQDEGIDQEPQPQGAEDLRHQVAVELPHGRHI